jgi:hypothetical protein
VFKFYLVLYIEFDNLHRYTGIDIINSRKSNNYTDIRTKQFSSLKCLHPDLLSAFLLGSHSEINVHGLTVWVTITPIL